MNRGFAGALAFILGLASPLTALGAGPAEWTTLAEPPTVNPEPQQREDPPEIKTHWYGWQTLASDASSLAVILTGLELGTGASGSNGGLTSAWAVVGLGTAGYLGGGPTVHAFHHNPGRAIASVGLRAGLPIISALIGSTAETCSHRADDDFSICGLDGAVAGFAIGMLSAIAIDASALSWDDHSSSKAREDATSPQLGFTPVISSDGKRGELRLFGTF